MTLQIAGHGLDDRALVVLIGLMVIGLLLCTGSGSKDVDDSGHSGNAEKLTLKRLKTPMSALSFQRSAIQTTACRRRSPRPSGLVKIDPVNE